MQHFLLDTNVFFDVIDSITKDPANSEIRQLRKEKCYISGLTKIEIISVLGKYARGRSKQTQICERTINESGDICGKKFYTPQNKGWKKRAVTEWRKLIKDITMGESPFFTVEVLPVTEEVCEEARVFINYALRYNFGSLDALIAATAIEYKKRTGTGLTIVTYDKKLLAAIRADGTIPHLNPKRTAAVPH